MADLSKFDPNAAGNPRNNIFGLPFSEDDSKVVLLPVPWEVTVSYGAGTARCAEHIFKASRQVEIFDAETPELWKSGFYMREIDKKVLLKSDYLRKEAELYIDYISEGEEVARNKFMCKSVKEINEGSSLLNKWVYEQTLDLINDGKLVGIIGGDHSTPFGYIKALSEKHGAFGILQIDAHCDLRKAYEGFHYSHASIMYNVLSQIPEVSKLVQVGVRDYSDEEWQYICNSNFRIITYFDQTIKERQYEGDTWKHIADEIVDHLPEKVYISFDIDGLDPKLCPNTGTPVFGGFEAEQVLYLFKKITASGRKIIGFDLVEVGVGEGNEDANVAARILWKMCNLLAKSNS
ncbi:agmatinase family protein [Danxiaibacter flavus]|uniref:Agmatinase family protein n=1 Tax=Danxiaibacter flavus TaxID=3049108 RepID=A0ABV3ZB71_9BACT|nr:agmatinase family protein [Chitinophagaceae bacterium DXS]